MRHGLNLRQGHHPVVRGFIIRRSAQKRRHPMAVAVATLPKRYLEKSVWDHLVDRQKQFRLFSLNSAPEAFSSTYERELQFAWDVWESRLTNPQATTFVAIPSTDPDHLDVRQVLHHEWLGQLVLVRMPQEDREGLSANAAPWTALQDELPHYHFSGMFIMPAACGQGVAQKLIEHAIASSTTTDARYTVVVWAKNKSARRAFEKCGFEVVREEMSESGSNEQESALVLECESSRRVEK